MADGEKDPLEGCYIAGGLHSLGWYLDYSDGMDFATLDGQFTAEDLEAIAAYMRGHRRV